MKIKQALSDETRDLPTEEKDKVLEISLKRSEKPKFIVRHGRGRTGGSTFLDFLVQHARSQGRSILIGDGDLQNATLSGLYPPGKPGGASQPKTNEIAEIIEWIRSLFLEMTEQQCSMVLDMGGGDRVLHELGKESELVELCEDFGIVPVGLFFMGPERDDLEHVKAIWDAKFFRPKHAYLVMNEHLVPGMRSTTGVFAQYVVEPEVMQLVAEGMETLILPRLPCMQKVRDLELGFFDAAAGKPGKTGKPLDPISQHQTKVWIRNIFKAIDEIGASEWLP